MFDIKIDDSVKYNWSTLEYQSSSNPNVLTQILFFVAYRRTIWWSVDIFQLGQLCSSKICPKINPVLFYKGVNPMIEMSTVQRVKTALYGDMVTMSSAGLQVLLSNTCVIYGYFKDNELGFMVNLDFYPHKCRFVQGTVVMF